MANGRGQRAETAVWPTRRVTSGRAVGGVSEPDSRLADPASYVWPSCGIQRAETAVWPTRRVTSGRPGELHVWPTGELHLAVTFVTALEASPSTTPLRIYHCNEKWGKCVSRYFS
jgi:hypothetical protein